MVSLKDSVSHWLLIDSANLDRSYKLQKVVRSKIDPVAYYSSFNQLVNQVDKPSKHRKFEGKKPKTNTERKKSWNAIIQQYVILFKLINLIDWQGKVLLKFVILKALHTVYCSKNCTGKFNLGQ